MSDALPHGDPPEIVAFNFSLWKRPIVRRFFPTSRVTFTDCVNAIPSGTAVAVWGLRGLPSGLPEGARVLRLEDGFLRSVGLGADLIRPLSWVVDERGMYFDARQPSDLEVSLAQSNFAPDLLVRARMLRRRIVDARLSKYNVGAAGWNRPTTARRVILVPGQVESDASLAYGAPGIKTNLGLVQAVRSANPDAYVIYKPHPDVVAGLRAKGIAEDEAQDLCNVTLSNVSIADLLSEVDEVQVLTSLAGFEALLRGKKVTCYGHPFYAGWGLTTDILPLARRTRRLTLDELVAGALIGYPRYMSRDSGALVSPEQAVDELLDWRSRTGARVSRRRELFRVILRRLVGVR